MMEKEGPPKRWPFFMGCCLRLERQKAESQSLTLFPCPPGGVLSWLGRPKKEPKKLGFCLISPPCIFGAKNLIKTGRSRIQSPKTAPGFEEPRLPFCQFLGFEDKG